MAIASSRSGRQECTGFSCPAIEPARRWRHRRARRSAACPWCVGIASPAGSAMRARRALMPLVLDRQPWPGRYRIGSVRPRSWRAERRAGLSDPAWTKRQPPELQEAARLAATFSAQLADRSGHCLAATLSGLGWPSSCSRLVRSLSDLSGINLLKPSGSWQNWQRARSSTDLLPRQPGRAIPRSPGELAYGHGKRFWP